MSYIEQACPIGTYRNEKKGKNITDCMECPINTFNDKTGQAACRKCGPSATSKAGNTTCRCIGAYREFFKSDSSCRCISGYYQTKYGIDSKQDDSALNCEPHVYSTCSDGETYNQNGECVSTSACSKQCHGGSGEYSNKHGVCICASAQPLDSVCNLTCRKSAVQTIITSTNVTMYNPNDTSETLTIDFTKYPPYPSSNLLVRATSSSTASILPTSPPALLSRSTLMAAASPAFTAQHPAYPRISWRSSHRRDEDCWPRARPRSPSQQSARRSTRLSPSESRDLTTPSTSRTVL